MTYSSKYTEKINAVCQRGESKIDLLCNDGKEKLSELIGEYQEKLEACDEKLQEISSSLRSIKSAESQIEIAKDKYSSCESEYDAIMTDIRESHEKINDIYTKINAISRDIFGYNEQISIPATEDEYEECEDDSVIEKNGKYYRVSTSYHHGKKDDLFNIIKELNNIHKFEKSEMERHAKDIEQKTKELYEKIEELLPGATAAGLTAAYEDAKSKTESNIRFWRRCFGGSLCAILCIIYWLLQNELISLSGDLTFEKTIVQVIKLFGCEFPCIWLAWTANVKIAQYTRILEEYQHKWAMARTFEGMRKAISQAENISNEHRDVFYYSILAAFSDNPSKIFDKKYEPEGPISTLNKLIDKIHLQKTTKKIPEE